MKIPAEKLRVYAVTDRSWLRQGETLTEVVEELLKAGVACVQLREKELPEEELLEEARQLKILCDQYEALLIINDRPDIALKVKASGVHVGLSDMAIEKARELLGDGYIIGGSAHNVEEALAAQEAGADYIGCGAVFGSKTKQDTVKLPIEELRKICQTVEIPAVAIGGITLENVSRISDTGIAGAAVVSALFAAENKTKAAEEFFEFF